MPYTGKRSRSKSRYTRKSRGGSRSRSRSYKRRKLGRSSGNVRTGGLYVKRGQQPRVGRLAEKKFMYRYFQNQTAVIPQDASFGWVSYTGGTQATEDFLDNTDLYQLSNILEFMKQGTSANERIGRKVALSDMTINYRFYKKLAFTNNIEIKMWVVLDKQCNGQPFDAKQYLAEPNAANGEAPTGGSSDTPDATLLMTSKANEMRYVTLATRTIKLDSSQGNAFAKNGQIRLNLKGLPIEYGGTTGAAAEIKTNNLAIVFAGANIPPTIKTDAYSAQFLIRTQYYDV